jgi:short-subunit dehydrogenase
MNVIVTGASKGIGREMSKILDHQGHKVLAIARSKAALESLKEEGSQIEVFAIDLNGAELFAEMDNRLQAWGEVDVLINNAGQLINKPFMETSVAEFESQFKSNVSSAIKMIQSCVPYINEGGHIVNISSMGGVQGSSKFPGLSAYSTSKGALSLLTECLAAELVEYKIKVNALALGAVQTEMLARAFPDFKAPLSAKEMARYIAKFALEDGHYYHGQVLPVALGNP